MVAGSQPRFSCPPAPAFLVVREEEGAVRLIARARFRRHGWLPAGVRALLRLWDLCRMICSEGVVSVRRGGSHPVKLSEHKARVRREDSVRESHTYFFIIRCAFPRLISI